MLWKNTVGLCDNQWPNNDNITVKRMAGLREQQLQLASDPLLRPRNPTHPSPRSLR